MPESVRILIVDDQPRARQSIRALLATVPCAGEIREAESGEEGLRAAEEFQPDVMLIDVLMPGMDGLQLTRAIKERWPQVRVIVLSMSSEFRERAILAGAKAFLTKGSPPELLLATFEAAAPAGSEARPNPPVLVGGADGRAGDSS